MIEDVVSAYKMVCLYWFGLEVKYRPVNRMATLKLKLDNLDKQICTTLNCCTGA